jgi:hypothetical protein
MATWLADAQRGDVSEVTNDSRAGTQRGEQSAATGISRNT